MHRRRAATAAFLKNARAVMKRGDDLLRAETLSVAMSPTSRGDFSVAKHTTVLKQSTNLAET